MLNVSRNGYYKFLSSSPSKREEENNLLLVKIERIHAKSRETYGSPRIHAALQLEGESCSRKRVAGLMKKAGIQAKMKKRFKVTTKVNPKARAAPNVLNRDFTAMKPNECVNNWFLGYLVSLCQLKGCKISTTKRSQNAQESKMKSPWSQAHKLLANIPTSSITWDIFLTKKGRFNFCLTF